MRGKLRYYSSSLILLAISVIAAIQGRNDVAVLLGAAAFLAFDIGELREAARTDPRERTYR